MNDNTRAAGILLPIFSLPSTYNQGCFSGEALRFIDFLAAAGMTYWQVLPLEPVDECFSPYRPESCFAMDPAFLDPGDLHAHGWLTDEEFEEEKALLAAHRKDPATGRLCYSAIRPIQEKYNRIAYQRFTNGMQAPVATAQEAGAATHDVDATTSQEAGAATPTAEADAQAFLAFCAANESWLPDFTMYHHLKEEFGSGHWQSWPDEYKRRNPQTLQDFQKKHRDALTFLAWEQWLVRSEWDRLHLYAEERGVQLVGDLPIYAAGESSDCWAHPELFQLNENLEESAVAGVPPDYFSADGQLWGNPLYRWDDPRTTDWWIDRIRQKAQCFDRLRIDHFRGFEAYFAIPNGGLPKDGHWEPGPGMGFFRALFGALPDLRERLIAEDLGFLTDGVRALLAETGFPGMKVLQFAFDSDGSNPYLPENCPENSVIYTGTHDNNTSRGWFAELPDWQRQSLSRYARAHFQNAGTLCEDTAALSEDTAALCEDTAALSEDTAALCEGTAALCEGTAALCSAELWRRWQDGDIQEDDVAELLMLLAARSDSRLAIFPMQDILNLGSEARINVPGIANGNWNWQMDERSLPLDCNTGSRECNTNSRELSTSLRELLARCGRA